MSQQPYILLVDDEPSVLSALRRTLRKEPYRLGFAGSAQDALEMMREEIPDLLVSDHLMPRMTGLELLKRCRLLYPSVGRIVLTGQAEMETVIDAINQGEVLRFLRKPWDDDDLKLTLHMAVEHLRLARENERLLGLLKDQAKFIRDLEEKHPGVADVRRDASGAILIDEDDLDH
ncbi:response regulator [Myxococcota bacterium]|nr:response regulator [Myxococcota bacterium]MBU1431532.1 response regulator [Myxococcota bacterium]MBU1899629.1 response regulator [Myxococcota bacterium]